MTISQETRDLSNEIIQAAQDWSQEEKLQYIRGVLKWPACGYLSLAEQQHFIAAHRFMTDIIDVPIPKPVFYLSPAQYEAHILKDESKYPLVQYVSFRRDKEGLFTMPVYDKVCHEGKSY